MSHGATSREADGHWGDRSKVKGRMTTTEAELRCIPRVSLVAPQALRRRIARRSMPGIACSDRVRIDATPWDKAWLPRWIRLEFASVSVRVGKYSNRTPVKVMSDEVNALLLKVFRGAY
jgi:hypothetical protein